MDQTNDSESAPVYYTSADVSSSDPTNHTLHLNEDVESQPNELAFSLLGAVLVILPLAVVRLYVTEEDLPGTVFVSVLILLGMALSTKGLLLQQKLMKSSKSIKAYKTKTYDTSLDHQVVEVSDPDRKALVMTFAASMILGSVQLLVIVYSIVIFVVLQLESLE